MKATQTKSLNANEFLNYYQIYEIAQSIENDICQKFKVPYRSAHIEVDMDRTSSRKETTGKDGPHSLWMMIVNPDFELVIAIFHTPQVCFHYQAYASGTLSAGHVWQVVDMHRRKPCPSVIEGILRQYQKRCSRLGNRLRLNGGGRKEAPTQETTQVKGEKVWDTQFLSI